VTRPAPRRLVALAVAAALGAGAAPAASAAPVAPIPPAWLLGDRITVTPFADALVATLLRYQTVSTTIRRTETFQQARDRVGAIARHTRLFGRSLALLRTTKAPTPRLETWRQALLRTGTPVHRTLAQLVDALRDGDEPRALTHLSRFILRAQAFARVADNRPR
jgi:hypothetical protein